MWPDEKYGPSNVNGIRYCEPLHNESALMEPINSWSNLVYSGVGAGSCGLAVNDVLRSPSPLSCVSFPFGPRLPENPLLGFICGLSWVGLGLTSFLFHASHKEIWWQLDVGFTNAVVVCAVCWSVLSQSLQLCKPSHRNAAVASVAMAALLVLTDALLFVFKFELEASVTVTILIALLAFFEIVAQPLLDGKSRRQWCLTIAAFLSMLVAYVVRSLEVEWGRPLCLYSEWFQPHAVWHVLTGTAIALIVIAWRSPYPPNAKPLWRRSLRRRTRSATSASQI